MCIEENTPNEYRTRNNPLWIFLLLFVRNSNFPTRLVRVTVFNVQCLVFRLTRVARYHCAVKMDELRWTGTQHILSNSQKEEEKNLQNLWATIYYYGNHHLPTYQLHLILFFFLLLLRRKIIELNCWTAFLRIYSFSGLALAISGELIFFFVYFFFGCWSLCSNIFIVLWWIL